MGLHSISGHAKQQKMPNNAMEMQWRIVGSTTSQQVNAA